MKHYDKSYHKGVVRYGLLSPKNPPQKQNKQKKTAAAGRRPFQLEGVVTTEYLGSSQTGRPS